MVNFKTAISAFYPNTCIGCGAIIDDGEHLCEYCYEMIPRVSLDKICTRCGLPKKLCECKNRVFYYNGCVSPFYKDGAAQEAMYGFKFARKTANAKYFSEQMSLSVKMVFSDIRFDAVTFVPMTWIKSLRRGFNQSYVLAKQIAEILNLPIIDNALTCKYKMVSQHDLPLKERFKNVEGLYSSKRKVRGNILLIDDIKTTGATLNECSKQLILSGADKIYCVTGLITKRKDR